MIRLFAIAFAAALTVADLPPTVRQTVEREVRGAAVSNIGKHQDTGVYEVSFVSDGQDRRISVTGDGTITEYRDKVTLASLPSPVRSAFEKAAAGAEISGVWRYLRGKTLFYSASIVRGGKKTTVRAEPDGNPVETRSDGGQ
jgi:hypothetical protein